MREFLMVVVLAAATAVHGQSLHLVSDIARAGRTDSSGPEYLAGNGRIAYFVAGDWNGRELWKTDGTQHGTRIVKDITPRFSTFDVHGLDLIFAGDYAYFTTLGDGGVRELWRTDGTPRGTISLTSAIGAIDSSDFSAAPLRDRTVVFTVNSRLWITDGSVAGTREIVNQEIANKLPENLVRWGAHVYFYFWGGSLYRTDGTPAGTQLVNSFGNDRIVAICPSDGSLFVVTSNYLPWTALWASDGTEAGTRRLMESQLELAARPAVMGSRVAISFKKDLYASDIWVSDGTMEGTKSVGTVPGQQFDFIASDAARAYFFTFTVGEQNRTDIGATDGTAGGTGMIAQFPTADFPHGATAGGRLFVQHGEGFYVIKRGEVALKLTTTCQTGATPSFAFLGENVVTSICDDEHGTELWITDGTPRGTHILANIAADSGSHGWMMRRFGEQFLFAAADPLDGYEPWISDGTTTGTRLLVDINPGPESSYPVNFTDLGNGKAIFSAGDRSNGRELWVTDGTTAGTHLVTELLPGPADAFVEEADPFGLAVLGHAAFFFARSKSGSGVWMTDGTAAGTREIAKLEPFYASRFNVANNLVFMETVAGLWRTDGTTAGTIQLAPCVVQSHVVSQRLFFVSCDDAIGNELSVSDGSIAGTRLVKDIHPGSESAFDRSAGTWLSHANGLLIFSADDGVNGKEIWRSDGTAAGTTMIKDITAGSGSSFVPMEHWSVTASTGDIAFFRANDGVQGAELWRSDGTSDGTFMLRDIAAGEWGSYPAPMQAAFGRVYFSADDEIHGRELWSSDGTKEGTVLVADVNSGPWASWPGEFIALGRSLYFFATTEEIGDELWQYTPGLRRRSVRR